MNKIISSLFLSLFISSLSAQEVGLSTFTIISPTFEQVTNIIQALGGGGTILVASNNITIVTNTIGPNTFYTISSTGGGAGSTPTFGDQFGSANGFTNIISGASVTNFNTKASSANNTPLSVAGVASMVSDLFQVISNNLKVFTIKQNGDVFEVSLTVTNGITNLNLGASSFVLTDANKKMSSVVQTGVSTDYLGGDGLTHALPASSGGTNNFVAYTNISQAFSQIEIFAGSIQITNTTTTNNFNFTNGIEIASHFGNGATVVPILISTNPSPAALGAQQWSGALELDGNAWNATTSGSTNVAWRVYNTPVQGNPPTSILSFDSQIGGATKTSPMTLTSANVLSLGSAGTLNATFVTVPTSGSVSVGGNQILYAGVGNIILHNASDNLIATFQSSVTNVSKTANYTVVALDSGTAFNNLGATAPVTFTLPTARNGEQFWFYNDAGTNLVITASGSDTIQIGNQVTAAAGSIGSSALGSVIHLWSDTALKWIAMDAPLGDWSSTQILNITNTPSLMISNAIINGSATAPVVDITGTWNTSATPSPFFRVNLTNTASAGTGLLVDYELNGASQFKVTRAGVMTSGGGASIGGTTTISSGNLTVSSGDVIMSAAGKGLQVKSGSNAKIGENTLVAGTVTVATTAFTASSIVLMNEHTTGGTPGVISYVGTAGTGFVITSTSALDTSTVVWMIVEKN